MAPRDDFLLDPNVVFLNHGSYGACPRPVFERYQAWQRELERQPVEFLARREAALLLEARSALAEYVGASVEDLVFATNATSALNSALRSLELGPDDEIVTTDHEYGALALTLDWIGRRTGARIVRARLTIPVDSEAALASIWGEVTERTRVLFVSHVTSATAALFPVEELCRRAREAGVLAIVDGAHAPGQIPLALDRLGAGIYAGNCHKWLCAPKGAAFLHVRRELQELVEPLVLGWGYAEDSTFIRRHELQATRDPAAYLAVPAAIDFVREHGRAEQCRTLLREAGRRLSTAGYEPTAPLGGLQMASFRLPDCDPKEVQRRLLEEYGIEGPCQAWGDVPLLRISVAAYTTAADLGAARSCSR